MSPVNASRSGAAVQGAVWTTYGVVHFAAAIPGYLPADVRAMAWVNALRAGTGLLVSSVLHLCLLGIARRRALTPALLASCAVLAVAGSQAWGLVDRSLLVLAAPAVHYHINWDYWPRGLELDYPVMLLGWTAGWFMLHFAREARERERALASAQLEARDAQLRAIALQLNPHFLFNTLNAIRGLTVEAPEAAREMITNLAGVLRHALQSPEGGMVSLSEELEAVEQYLAIQGQRFGDSLRWRVEADAGARHQRVPRFVLQPLVENAVTHGARREGAAMEVVISARRTATQLVAEVSNPGSLRPGFTAGTGTRSARARLERLGGSLTLAERGGLVVASLAVPLDGVSG
ncbi:MAG: sensor histidine kinase [Gemmatimonadetes bacterium]|nr:sensor histidine kinase [Gemmatimonadota bacterium]